MTTDTKLYEVLNSSTALVVSRKVSNVLDCSLRVGVGSLSPNDKEFGPRLYGIIVLQYFKIGAFTKITNGTRWGK